MFAITAPPGSVKIAIRPTSMMSIGSTFAVPPAFLTAASVESESSTLTYVVQAAG